MKPEQSETHHYLWILETNAKCWKTNRTGHSLYILSSHYLYTYNSSNGNELMKLINQLWEHYYSPLICLLLFLLPSPILLNNKKKINFNFVPLSFWNDFVWWVSGDLCTIFMGRLKLFVSFHTKNEYIKLWLLDFLK